MGLLVPKLRGFSRQWSGGCQMGLRRTTRQRDNQWGGSHLQSCGLVVCEAVAEHKPKIRHCQPLLTTVSPRIPPKGEYLRGILEWWRTEVLTSRRDFKASPRLQDNESTRQRVRRQPLVDLQTCGLVVCEAIAEPKAVADSQLMTQYSFVCEAATKPKPITDKNGTKRDKTGQNRTKQDKTGQIVKVTFRMFVSLQNQTEKCVCG